MTEKASLCKKPAASVSKGSALRLFQISRPVDVALCIIFSWLNLKVHDVFLKQYSGCKN